MLLYVLYACVHVAGAKHAHQPGKTQCVEAQTYFHVDECRKALAKGAELKKPGKHPQSWLQCQQSRADSWIPADASDSGSQVYKAEASVSDAGELTALLAPLSPQARATLGPADVKSAFQRSFQGPGNLSFFVVGTGSKVIVFAVTHLDDFQFADMAADVSSSSEGMPTGKDLDVETMAEDAGVELSYHTEMSQRAAPPPGGVTSGP